MAISILCPTRGRPENVNRLIESAAATAHGAVEIIFYVDVDDETMQGDWAPAVDPKIDVKVLSGPRITLSECWNRAAEQAQYPIMMHCGDDIIFRSDAWDVLVYEAFQACADKILLVHGRDGIHDGNLATHGFLSRRWVDTVGYFVPPYFASDYNDLWLSEVADKLGRRKFIPEIYTEHMHPAANKAPIDRTHQERMERHARENCDAIYTSTAQEREEWVRKLQAAMW